MSDLITIVDTGEVLTPQELAGELTTLAMTITSCDLEVARLTANLSTARAAADRARERVRQLLPPGGTYPVGGGRHLGHLQPKRPARRVNHAAVDEHRDALTRVGLGPRVEERMVVDTVYPLVRDLVQAETTLLTVGLTVDQLTVRPAPAPGEVRVSSVVPS